MSLIVDIKKRLGSFSLSAQLEAGEGVTGILGSSGCGKSMTLKCIAGIERPDSGHIELDGVVLYDSRKRIDIHPQQRRVGYLFQNYALFPNMTLRQNILCGLRNQPDKAQRVKEADDMIAMMDLQGLEKHRPYQLSGGQQQRVAERLQKVDAVFRQKGKVKERRRRHADKEVAPPRGKIHGRDLLSDV